MKVAIDVSPLESGHFLQHRVRGTGFYLENLRKSLRIYQPELEVSYIKRGEKVSASVDLVHIPYFEPYFITLPLRKVKKTIVTVHDLTPMVFKKEFPPGKKGNLKWLVQKNSLMRSDAIITDSNCSKKDIVRFLKYSEEKVHVVYLAAAEHFKPIEESKAKSIISKFDLPEKFILYVGDATWNKNLPRLIEAVNKTEQSLVIVGKAFKDTDYDLANPWNRDLKKAQEFSKNNSKIISLGFVTDEELVSLYNLANLLVMPSIYEGFGLPVLEAMASGCPVVCSSEGSLSEVAGEAAFIVNPRDVNSIADGISKVFSDKQLSERLINMGIKQASSFSWKKTAEKTADVYKKVHGANV